MSRAPLLVGDTQDHLALKGKASSIIANGNQENAVLPHIALLLTISDMTSCHSISTGQYPWSLPSGDDVG